MKIAVITDSTSTLTKAEQQKYNIHILSTPVSIGGKEYREGVNINSAQLFAKIDAGEGFPKTSQPSMGEALEMCQNLHDQGYEAIILITLTHTISGFFNTMQNIAQMHPELNLHPYDSHLTVKMQGYLAIAASIMAQNGLEPAEIINRLDQIAGNHRRALHRQRSELLKPWWSFKQRFRLCRHATSNQTAFNF